MRTLICAMCVVMLPACGGDDGPTPAPVDTYEPPPAATLTEVEEQVWKTGCSLSASCHKGPTGAGGLVLEGDTFPLLVDVKSLQDTDANLITPGDPEASYLFVKLQPDPPFGTAMPKGDAAGLDAERLEMVRSWILAGAKDD